MGPRSDGRDSRYNVVHTASEHMAADLYTKGFTDKRTFGNLKRLINVYSTEEIEDGKFSPPYDDDDIPSGAKDWVNTHFLSVTRVWIQLPQTCENQSSSKLQRPKPKLGSSR